MVSDYKKQCLDCIKSLKWLQFNIVGLDVPKQNTFEYAAMIYLQYAIDLLKIAVSYE